MRASLRLLLFSSTSVLAGAALLARGETAGLFTDVSAVDTAPTKAVLTRYASRSGTVDDFLASQSGSAKLVYDVSGNLVWSPHNQLLQSQTAGVSPWALTAVTVTSDVIAAPDGTLTADKLVEDATTTSPHRQNQTVTVIQGEVYCYSVCLKAAERTWIFLQTSVAAVATAFFDLSNGVVGTTGGANFVSAAITSLGNGWYRCQLVLTAATSTSMPCFVQLASSSSINSYDGVVGNGLYVWGAQLNRGTVPTTYLATTTAARYGLARDYDPITHAALGLKTEPAATNVVLQASAFDSAPWVATAVTITPNAAVAPDGTTTADRILEDSTSSRHLVQQSGALPTAAQYTFSCFMKAGPSTTWGYLRTQNGTDGEKFVYVNLSTGALGTVTAGATGAIVSVGNGWYRVSLTTTPTIGTSGYVGVTNADNVLSHLGASTLSVYAWGAQSELGASATSPIPTFAATQTRAADSNQLFPSNFPLSQIAGTWVADQTISSASGSSGRIVGELTGSNTALYYASQTTIGMYNGVIALGRSISPSSFANGVKIASAWDATGRSLTGGGLTPATDTLVQAAPVNLSIGSGSGGTVFIGYTRSVRYLSRRATDTELANWTNATAVPASEPGIAIDFQANTVSIVGTDLYYALDQFYTNAGTSPKQVNDKTGALVWSAHNLALNSEDFTAWTQGNSPVTTAHTIQDTSATLTSNVSQSIPAVSGSTCTWTCWVLKDAVTTRFPIFELTSNAIQAQLELNTSTGASGFATNPLNAVASVSDGGIYWIVSLTYVNQAASTSVRIYPAAQSTFGTNNVAAIGTVQIDKTQFNYGTVPTAYLRTTTAARYGLAIDYDPVTHACKGTLSEAAATNSIVQSMGLGTASWTATNLTVGTDGTLAPDGITAAFKLTSTVATGPSLVVTTLSGLSAALSTFSFFAKKGSGSNFVAVSNASNFCLLRYCKWGSRNYW
jgi:hypothetical protein